MPSTPPHVVAKRAPGCNRSSCGAVLESHRALFCLGVAAVSTEAASLGHPADFKEGRQRLQHVPATAAARPQDLLENLNAEEPANPTPPIPNPELCYMPDCRVCSAEQVGLAWPNYRGGAPITLPLARQSQSHEHCFPGSSFTRAAPSEDGGAAASLHEVFLHTCTSAFGTLGDSTGSHPWH